MCSSMAAVVVPAPRSRGSGVTLRAALAATVQQLKGAAVVKYLVLQGVIGQGGYGSVYHGLWRGLQGVIFFPSGLASDV